MCLFDAHSTALTMAEQRSGGGDRDGAANERGAASAASEQGSLDLKVGRFCVCVRATAGAEQAATSRALRSAAEKPRADSTARGDTQEGEAAPGVAAAAAAAALHGAEGLAPSALRREVSPIELSTADLDQCWQCVGCGVIVQPLGNRPAPDVCPRCQTMRSGAGARGGAAGIMAALSAADGAESAGMSPGTMAVIRALLQERQWQREAAEQLDEVDKLLQDALRSGALDEKELEPERFPRPRPLDESWPCAACTVLNADTWSTHCGVCDTECPERERLMDFVLRLAENVLDSPQEPRFRRLKTQTLMEHISVGGGALNVLKNVGFVEQGERFVLPPEADLAPLRVLVRELHDAKERIAFMREKEGTPLTQELRSILFHHYSATDRRLVLRSSPMQWARLHLSAGSIALKARQFLNAYLHFRSALFVFSAAIAPRSNQRTSIFAAKALFGCTDEEVPTRSQFIADLLESIDFADIAPCSLPDCDNCRIVTEVRDAQTAYRANKRLMGVPSGGAARSAAAP